MAGGFPCQYYTDDFFPVLIEEEINNYQNPSFSCSPYRDPAFFEITESLIKDGKVQRIIKYLPGLIK